MIHFHQVLQKELKIQLNLSILCSIELTTFQRKRKINKTLLENSASMVIIALWYILKLIMKNVQFLK